MEYEEKEKRGRMIRRLFSFLWNEKGAKTDDLGGKEERKACTYKNEYLDGMEIYKMNRQKYLRV